MSARPTVLAGVLAFLIAAGAIAAERTGFRPIDLTTRPIDSFAIASSETRFGGLEFRGGLVLNSSDPLFGSLSGLDFSLDGSAIYAITDTGHWFTARPVERDGRIVGLTDARLAPILNGAGNALAGKHYGDAESLRIVERNGKEAGLVSFERANDIRQFAADPEIADARSKGLKLPSSMKNLDPNKGLEAIAAAPAAGRFKGAIVAIAERSLDKAGNHRAWIIGGPGAGAFTLARTGSYDVTDAAFLPDGDLLVLERKFSLVGGLAMRIRRIAEADLRPGVLVDGSVLIESDMRNQIDNMEALAVHTNAAGETLIAVASDNNNNPIQRSLILFFALSPVPAAATAENPKT